MPYSTHAGGCDYDAALEYIKWKFMNVRKDKTKQIYVLETTATDTKNMEFIIKVHTHVLAYVLDRTYLPGLLRQG